MRFALTSASAALVAGVSAQNYLGFNSGSTKADRSAKFKADFLSEFNTAQNLPGAPGLFNAVRLYTNIQAYSEADPIEAFEAALETNTLMLLGVWTSGTDSIQKEVVALQTALKKYGKPFADLVIGISIGSEDLYRNSATGVANKAGIGAQPDTIVRFIGDFKTAFAGTSLAGKPIGHVDTWDVWPNATNKPVIDAIDFLGIDEYPYYENGKGNDITNAANLFDAAYDAAVAAAGGKPVWLTETGWPVTGPAWDQAIPSVENAKTYWDQIGCRRLFNKVPTFWYTLRDSNPDNDAKFAVARDLQGGQPAFNLTCPTSFATDNSDSNGSSAGNGNSNNSGGAPAQGSTGGNGNSPNAGAHAVVNRFAGGLAAVAALAMAAL